jgi:hypothetical protein
MTWAPVHRRRRWRRRRQTPPGCGRIRSIDISWRRETCVVPRWSNEGMSTQWNGWCVCMCDTRSTVSMLICQYVSDKVVTTSLNVVIYCIAKILFRPFPKWKDATWWHSRCVKQTF